MSRYAICLVTDQKYMLPTVIAATQAKAACPVDDVDVFIFAVGMKTALSDRYTEILSQKNIKLVLADRDLFGSDATNNFIDEFFSTSALSFGALGRLFLDQLLPPEYDQILYLDGDIQIDGSLAELVYVEAPEGCLLAAADPKVFWINDDSAVAAKERSYMAGLGLSPADFTGYFNSGILRVSRAAWREIGRTAWEFLRDSPDLCICHDQSALNFASRGRRVPMSMKWNFPAYWNFYGLAAQVSPRITHFMSRPKPWNGAFPPWGRAQQKPYLEFVAAHPDLASELDEFGLKLTVRYNLQQRAKWLDELAHGNRRRSVSSQVLDYEKTALV